MAHKKYRLGLDLGTNSIGWAIYLLDESESPRPIKLLRVGSRIFSDGRNPKDGSSLAVQRRTPRQHRRRRDRFLRRQDQLLNALVFHGLMPKDEAARKALVTLNPYELRAKGANGQISLHEFGRALFHLNQRRGFKSNRKTDKGADDSGKIKSAIAAFRATLGDAKTLGEALWTRLSKGEPVRARLLGEGAKAAYELYVERAMVEAEFAALFKAQQAFYPNQLTEAVQTQLHKILFFQRDLRPVDPGKCFLEPDLPRAPEALPSAQLFRLYQEVNHLRLITLADKSERPLTRAERDHLIAQLDKKAEIEFAGLRKTLFGANVSAFRFSIESERRKKLIGNVTAYRLANKKAFGARWHAFSLEEQDRIVEQLLDVESEQTVIAWLQKDYGLTLDVAQAVSDTTLPDGHIRLSRRAIGKVLPALREGWDVEKDQALTYDKAVAQSYGSHTIAYLTGDEKALPYYGEILWRYTANAPTAGDAREREFGRIANPTVHIGLNQVRLLVNAIIKKYGKPTEIIVELARELKRNQKQQRDYERQQTENQKTNDEIRSELARLNVKDNAENRLRFKLYRELGALDRHCVYTNRQIELTKLFTNAYQIDHILPFSQTLDDSYNNKLLVHREANKIKTNLAPYQAFSHSPSGYDWNEIYARAQRLPREKFKRFYEAGLKDFLRDQDFLARQLTDTAYLARVAREYLSAICHHNRIWVTPGRLTALLRGKWGLNHILFNSGSKERTDHRHHAIDACVIGVTDRGLLNEVSRRVGQAEEQDLERLFGDFYTPWETFYQDVERCVKACVVSFKPDHGAQGGLHEETAYGIVSGPDDKGVYDAFVHVPLVNLKSPADFDDVLPVELGNLLRDKAAGTADFKACLAQLVAELKLKRVKISKKISGVTVPLKKAALEGKALERRAAPAKLYKGGSNYCYELYRNEKGKWTGDLITMFVANQKAYRAFRWADERAKQESAQFRAKTFAGKPLVMRLMIDDTLMLEDEGVAKVFRVVKMTGGEIALAPDHEAGSLKARDANKDDPFRYLTKSPNALIALKARRVFVDPLGFVLDKEFKA